MPNFNPNLPAENSDGKSAEMRNQLNALNDQNTLTNARIDNLPPPIPGPQGPTGAPGRDGRSINPRGTWSDADTYNRLDLVAHENALYLCLQDNTNMATPGTDPRWMPCQIAVNVNQINGNLTINGMLYTGGLGLGVSDPGSSGESGVLLGATPTAGTVLPLLTIRNSGMTAIQLTLDFGGQIDGMGSPTIQHGDLITYDGMAGSLKPTRNDTARNPAGIQPLTITSEDPNQQAIIDKINQLIGMLVR